MKLIYATTNKAKLALMKDYVEPLGIKLIGLIDSYLDLSINESGCQPNENAKIKALAYFRVLKMPLFACDSGLFFENVPLEFQPGVHVRRINGKTLSDEETIAYYSSLAAQFGGRLTAQYKNAICLIISENEIYEYMGEDIASEKFIITSKPHTKRVKGFPLDSLSIDIKTEKYYFDQENFRCSTSASGFQDFFKRTLKLN